MRIGMKWMGSIAALVMLVWVSPASAQHPLDGKLTVPISVSGEVYRFDLFDQVAPGTQIPDGAPRRRTEFRFIRILRR